MWWVQVLGHHGCRTAQAVMGHDSLPHAATGVFDTAGCRTTSFHDARVVGGRAGDSIAFRTFPLLLEARYTEFGIRDCVRAIGGP